jgi:DNA-binding phage protein
MLSPYSFDGILEELKTKDYWDVVDSHKDLFFKYSVSEEEGKQAIKNAIKLRSFLISSSSTMNEVAYACGVSRNTIYNLTKGYAHSSNETIDKVNLALGTDLEYLQ